MQQEDHNTDDEDLGAEVELESTEDDAQDDAPSERVAASDGEGGDDLDEYSRGVQKRIKKLTEKYRREERDRQEAVRLAEQLMQENQHLKGRVQQLDSGYLSEYGSRVEAQLAAARQAYRDAYEANDPDRIVQAQEALARATADSDRYSLAKQRADRTQQLQQRQQQQPQQQQYYQQPQQPQQPQVDERAQSWAEKNSWFGQDQVMTYAAFGIHRKLVEEEGFDPQSDEYYTEVDRRLRAEFPHKFKGDRKTGGSQVAPAGSSASRSTKQGRGKTVKLSPSQIAIARRLNVPLEEYAKYVKD